MFHGDPIAVFEVEYERPEGTLANQPLEFLTDLLVSH
jgi:hypothetical protein